MPVVLGNGVLRRQAVNYLLRDEFLTAASAPLGSPRTCEPIGRLYRSSDTANIVSIDSLGNLKFSGTIPSGSYDNPAYYFTKADGSAFAHSKGIVLMYKIIPDDVLIMGWSTSTTVNLASTSGIRIATAGAFNLLRVSTAPVIGAWDTAAPTYLIALVAAGYSDGGYHVLIKGGAYADWSLLFSEVDFAPGTMYPIISAITSTMTVYFPWVRVSADSGLWLSEPATLNQSSPVDATIYTGTADGVHMVRFPTQSGSAGRLVELRVNVQDASNYRLVRWQWNGAAWEIVVGAVVAGSETVGAPVASANNQDALQVRTIGSAIEVWTRTTSSKAWTRSSTGYTNANFTTQTGVAVHTANLSSAPTQLISLPYQGAAASAALDRIAS